MELLSTMTVSGADPGNNPANHGPRKPPGAAEMGFFEHVDELRARAVSCLAVFLAGFIFCFLVTNEWVLAFLREPLFQALPPGERKLYFTSLFENFLTHLKIAAYSSVFLFSPFYLFQFWKFVAPGLHARERKLVLPFSLGGAVFFIGGGLFAYWVLFPVGFKYFVQFGSPSDVALLTIDSYYSTCLKLMLLFGVGFELPVVVTLLGYLGLVDAPFLRAQRKMAILVITVFSALFAPPDAVSMLILMAPLILFYEGSIHVVGWLGARRSAPEAADPSSSSESPLAGRSR